jgi:hypothetical protein
MVILIHKFFPVRGGGGAESVYEGEYEYGVNAVCTCIWIEKWDLLKLSQEWGEGR